jgi:hypothetical protein
MLRLPYGRALAAFLIAASLALNAFVFAGRAGPVLKIFKSTFGLSNERRRLMMYGSLYGDIIAARRAVPETATLWWVSPEYPWLVNYYLYPRILRWGSPNVLDREELRRKHPSDWVVGYSSSGDRLELQAPAGS